MPQTTTKTMLEEREQPSPARAEPANSPTFSQTSGEGESPCDNSPQQISAAPVAASVNAVYGDDDDEEEFEFAFVVRSSEPFPPITADDNFPDGQILSVYPIFNRSLLVADGNRSPQRTLLKLLNEERDRSSASSSSSSTGDDVERVPRWTYCLWEPGAGRATKRSSGRESSLRWRILDLLVGRLLCNGKERIVLLAAKKKKSPEKVAPAEAADGAKEKGKRKKDAEIDLKEAHRVYHRPNGRRTSPMLEDVGGGRKPYTPYKPDVVEFFGGVKCMGMFHHSC